VSKRKLLMCAPSTSKKTVAVGLEVWAKPISYVGEYLLQYRSKVSCHASIRASHRALQEHFFG